MGIHISIEIGPYLQVKGKLEKKEIKIKRLCPNHRKQNNENAKFCSSCGTEIQNVEFTETKTLSPARVVWEHETFDNFIWSPPEMEDIFLPNGSVPNKIKFDPEYGDGVIDLSSVDEIKAAQQKWMSETYSDQIDFLIQNFGKENVFVKWGIVSYWS